MKQIRFERVFKLLAALLLSGLCAVMAVCAVTFEHHWGFLLVLDLMGKSSDESMFGQFLVSGLLKFCCVSFLAAGLVFGYLKEHWKGSKWWNIAGSLVPFPLYFAVFFDSSNLTEVALVSLSMAGFSAIVFNGFSLLGENLFRAVKKKTRPWHIILPGLFALSIPFAIMHFSESVLDTSWRVNCGIDFITIFAAAFGAAMMCSRKEPTASLVAAAVATFPFILFNILNVGNNLLLLCLFEADLRAILSSLIISIVCVAAICSGALCGRLPGEEKHGV